MKNCLIIINIKSGSSQKIGFDTVKKALGDEYNYTCCTLPNNSLDNIETFDAIAICGGDGTLSSILERVVHLPIDVFYFPVGTLNDKAKAQRYRHKNNDVAKPIVIGKCKKVGANDDENIFTYVLAAGSFTPIGYTTKVEKKKKYGVFAYINKVINEYKPHSINATISFNDKSIEGEFSLIMFLKSPRCFGFKFNRAYNLQNTNGHLLAIRTPKGCKIAKYIKMFFPFFRAFFVGFDGNYMSKNIVFESAYNIKLTMNEPYTYCKDGEKLDLEKGEYIVKFERTLCNFKMIDKF